MTVNLSKYEASEADLSLLERGLSFVPSRKTLPISNILDTRDNVIRRLKLKCFFENNKLTNRNIKDRRFIEKSTWVPPNHKLKAKTLVLVDDIVRKTGDILNEYKVDNDCVKLYAKNNLSREELMSIRKLKENKDIVIKPADKGGATVILDRDAYLKEAYRQLNDIKYYVRLNKPVYHDNASKISEILNDMNLDGFISNEQLEFLSGPRDYRPRNIYFLPKIHKDRSKWPWPDMPEARPICSDFHSETHRISSYIDSFLNPLACNHASYIKNSFEFVNRIRDAKFDKNCLLVTGDVSSLYTNMHHGRTIKCVEDCLVNNPDASRPDMYILQLLDLILKNNDFVFNNETFLQVLGTAMGKVFSPSLANIYLLEFDEKAMNGFPIKPLLFFRYLDDVFMIWPGSVAQLKEYELFLNGLIPDIKITLEYSNIQISFLDVLIYVEDERLKTRTFFKQTDTHQLLHTQSFHPNHTTRGIIKSQLIRFKRLSSSALDYNNSCKILFSFLKFRGYSLSVLRKMQYEILFRYSDEYCCFQDNGKLPLTRKNHNIEPREMLPIVVDFCSIGTELANSYKKLIHSAVGVNKFSLITAYRNSRNLRQMLISSKFVGNAPGAFRGCDQSRCLTCRLHAAPKTQISSSVNNRVILIKNNISCSTINVIYIITCRSCNLQYVGETGRSLRDRVNDHRSAIKNNTDTPIGQHFNLRGHSVADLSITPIEVVENMTMRRNKEKALQKYLKTIHPDGINHLPTH